MSFPHKLHNNMFLSFSSVSNCFTNIRMFFNYPNIFKKFINSYNTIYNKSFLS